MSCPEICISYLLYLYLYEEQLGSMYYAVLRPALCV